MHTSTITVAVLDEVEARQVNLDPKDLEIKTCRGSGAGGQHRNVTDSAVQITHKPSGLMVRCEGERSQHQNKEMAMDLLRARLSTQQQTSTTTRRNKKRKAQVGTGMRADKIRTAALQRGQVTDHRSGKTINSKKYLRGEWEGLF